MSYMASIIKSQTWGNCITDVSEEMIAGGRQPWRRGASVIQHQVGEQGARAQQLAGEVHASYLEDSYKKSYYLIFSKYTFYNRLMTTVLDFIFSIIY